MRQDKDQQVRVEIQGSYSPKDKELVKQLLKKLEEAGLQIETSKLE